MGTAKADIVFEGRRLEAIAEAALAPHCDAVHRLGPNGLTDTPGVAGPLGGITAARAHAPEAWWVVMACDMPLVTPEAIRWLLDSRSPGDVAILPSTESGGPQPTLALYGPGVDPLLAAITAPIQLVGEEGVASPDVPRALTACWTNVNDPAALAALNRP
jgi:molybdopterin-guanine dinucleotide biosynthesis protein A